MKKFIYFFIGTLGLLLLNTYVDIYNAPANASFRLNEIASVSGKHLLIIQAALNAFEKNDLKIDDYIIRINEENNLYYVLFQDPNRPTNIRGSSPNMPEFEVQLSKDNLKVVKAHFVQ